MQAQAHGDGRLPLAFLRPSRLPLRERVAALCAQVRRGRRGRRGWWLIRGRQVAQWPIDCVDATRHVTSVLSFEYGASHAARHRSSVVLRIAGCSQPDAAREAMVTVIDP